MARDKAYPSEVAKLRPLSTRIWCEEPSPFNPDEETHTVHTVRENSRGSLEDESPSERFNRELRGGQPSERLRRG